MRIIKMGYLKNKYLEGIQKETEVTLSEYKRGKKKYTEAEQKKIDDMIDCQIEDAKIKRDEEGEEGGKGVLG